MMEHHMQSPMTTELENLNGTIEQGQQNQEQAKSALGPQRPSPDSSTLHPTARVEQNSLRKLLVQMESQSKTNGLDSSSSSGYTSLTDPSVCIRLLAFQRPQASPSDTTEIHCTLHTFVLVQAPSYNTISYTWGPPTPATTVHIDGRPMNVRPNCAAVLRQAQRYDPKAYYWIDAICIDQNNLQEKGQQVQMMSNIFSRGELVVAYAGEHANDSRFLYDTLQESAGLFKTVGGLETRWRIHGLLTLRLRIWLFSRSKDVIVRLYSALDAFLKRNYFRRVWVFQELFLGRRVDIHCGSDFLPIQLLHGFKLACEFWGNGDDMSRWVTQGLRVLRFGNTTSRSYGGFQGYTPNDNTLVAAGSFNMELLELPTLILKVSNLECENRLDKVYGILSMVRWNDNEKPIRTDYTKDRFDLALETLEVIARRRVPNLISYGERVARNLDLLGGPSPKLKEAIQKRGVPPVMPEASDFAETRELTDTGFNPNSRSRIVFEGCRLTKNGKGEWGFQATNDRGNAEETTGPYHSKRPHQWPVSVTTMDLLGDAPILIPKSAQDGDWCLFMKWSRIEADTLILIAREHVDKRHLWIVGKGWGERPVTLGQENGESRNFHVYLGAEDAMVISIQCPMHSWPFTTLGGIQNFIESGVCGSPGSSYAELYWS